jgi:uncharacterized lipoprotein YajG
MKRTLILLIITLLMAGCVTQVNTTSQANNPIPIASTQKPSLLPSILNWIKWLRP